VLAEAIIRLVHHNHMMTVCFIDKICVWEGH
jgi:hypothetical protein